MPLERNKALASAYLLAFGALLLAPTADLVLRPASARSTERENRRPAPPPAWPVNLALVSAAPRGAQSWFDDRCGLRDVLLGAKQSIDVRLLGLDPAPATLRGADDWLFFGADHALESFRGLHAFAPAELREWVDALAERTRWCADRGIAYVFAIAPNKEQIYPERWPERFTRVGDTRLDQLTRALSARHDVEFLDLRPALHAEAAHDAGGDYAYYPLGSHWTPRGAWAACSALAERLAARFPGITPTPREHLRVERAAPDDPGDTLAALTYVADHFAQLVFTARVEPSHLQSLESAGARADERLATSDRTDLPSLLFVHDSFGPSCVPFLAEFTSRVHAVPEYLFPKELVLAERPDIIVEMMTERGLSGPPQRLSAEVDVLTRGAFDRLEVAVGRFDVGAGVLPSTVGGARAERVQVDGALAIAFEVGAPGAGLQLEIPTPPSDREFALRVELTSPAPVELWIFYTTPRVRSFNRQDLIRVGVRAGRTEFCFQVRAHGLGGQILIVPSGVTGRFLLHALEVRCSQAKQ